MALFDSISDANRVVEQGDTWDCETKCVGSYTTRENGAIVTFYQWDCSVTLAKSYKYVGLTEAAAVGYADDITDAYKKQRTKTISRWDQSARKWIFEPVQNVEELQAMAVPRHADGPTWEISVTVSAREHRRFDSSTKPTIATLEGWLADVADYPELQTAPSVTQTATEVE